MVSGQKQYCGRKVITTSRKIVGDIQSDLTTISKILQKALPIHDENAREEARLFKIYFNDGSYWCKNKEQRPDINNKITIDDAWAISRTINGYCFGEPIKYVTRRTNSVDDIQSKVEELSAFLDYQHNHDATIMATLSSSVCGLGYKLALPATREEYEDTGVPFVINPNLIHPTKAFCVYSSDIMHEKVLGVLIGDYYNDNDEPEGNLYTVWTKYHTFTLTDDSDNINGYKMLSVQRHFINRIPLVEVERNAYRKGDWEVVTDLFELKNKLQSDRIDDVQQVVDYILLLINCKFETKEDRDDALKNRLFELEIKDGGKTAPSVEILKNPLDQNGVQALSNYIDSLIESVAGIPNRAERGGGGHDTGAAVIYRNGFRDLENNAGMIIPKMDKAETEFLGVCIAYSHTLTTDPLKGLKSSDVRNKFVRSMSDDPVSASNAYSTFRNAGMNDLDALIASRAVTDPSEVHKNNMNNQVQVVTEQNSAENDLTNVQN